MDVQNRWNSTFLMLETALPLKDAFCRLEQMERNYKLNPSKNDWKVASVVHGCLKKIYEATCHFSGSNFPTANVFFPDICNLRLKMRQWEVSEHDFIREMAIPMKTKFEKYWEECSLMLAIAVVLDPRFKLALVEYYYNALYGKGGERYVDRVRNAIADLFVEYGGDLAPFLSYVGDNIGEGTSSSSNKNIDGQDDDDKLSDFDKWYQQSCSSTILASQKSELQSYLDEPVFPRKDDFDILGWWKAKSPKFPILSKMARDILAIPATTVHQN
nr:zinc finger BED domain-containing protein RICESLEEPER 2-like [Coffea arabica]